MRAVLWFLVGVLISAVPMLVFAEDYNAIINYKYGSSGTTLYPSANAACASSSTETITKYAKHEGDSLEYCYYKHPSTGVEYQSGTANRVWTCPGGGTVGQVGGVYKCVGAASCPVGTVRNTATGICETSCISGVSQTSRAWVGYAATSNNVDDWIDPRIPSSTCSGNCAVGNLSIVAGSCSVDDSGFGPPYPGSCEFSGTQTGATCTASDQTFDDPLPQIPCPSGSSLGSVNGVQGCYGSYQGNEATSTTTNPDGSTTKITIKIAPDGSTVKTTTTTAADGSVTTTEETITSTPASGEGAIDGQGTGSGSGSGSGAGTGTVNGTKGDSEQANFCRDNPGVALCKDKVKVDELDTPSQRDWTADNTALGDRFDEMKNYIEGSTWRRDSLPFVWNPQDQIPGGSCSDIQIGLYSLDICSPLSMARDLWAWCIGMVAALAIWIRGTQIMGRI